MFGHKSKPKVTTPLEADVDVHLEWDISSVQDAVDAYLEAPNDEHRTELHSALDTLDQQTAASDAYEQSIVDSAVFGLTSKGTAIGETSRVPIVDEVPATVFQAQVALVRAAKTAIYSPDSSQLDQLRKLSDLLHSMQAAGEASTS
jgi:hypothetical protein